MQAETPRKEAEAANALVIQGIAFRIWRFATEIYALSIK